MNLSVGIAGQEPITAVYLFQAMFVDAPSCQVGTRFTCKDLSAVGAIQI